MNKKKNIDKLIDEAINSLDHVERAQPMPFLLTRIQARLNKKSDIGWESAGWLIGRPVVAISGLAILMLINTVAIVLNRAENFSAVTEQAAQAGNDEFSYTVATIYDIENTEP